MATKGTKVERASVSDQPHELAYEAKKTGTSKETVKDAKATTGNQRKAIEKKVK
ncbi:DUF3606 domain-containing protein [Mucilaginibacter myungsuensis]|uniref:DUF3606 domain-containing protein n=1 Tax=Mucilaginibacter myungsuensis TaxID=649104 RepID=A0A929PV80_9SPHI|nr:DUF3606 domain-containing protein [Mucilaginibacter myungsuensis]MBE9660726.1 DUF3606 domain-containing protein [Mucilaginibacter myungsuensis]MDN3600771.1 DUF3606 domain-containing protein [Mucilaginibacter myungsuensis]